MFEKEDSTTVGYFGHLVELCNEIISATGMSESLSSYVNTFDRWGTFTSGKLEEINEICNTGPNQTDDEDEDFNYDAIPEQYYFGNQFNGVLDTDEEDDEDKLAQLGKMLDLGISDNGESSPPNNGEEN